MENGEDGKTSSVGQSTSRHGSTLVAHVWTPVRSASLSLGPTKPATQRGSTATTALSGNKCQSTTANGHQPAARQVWEQLDGSGSRPSAITRWNSVDELIVDVRASVERGRSDAASLPAAKTTIAPGTFAVRHLTSSSNEVGANTGDERFQESDDKVEVRQERPGGAEYHKATANQNVSDAVNHVDETPVITKTRVSNW